MLRAGSRGTPGLWYHTVMKEDVVILGTASERRRLILAGLGIRFDVDIPEVDEIFYPADPQRTASENSLLKNHWCRKRHSRARIITADTVIDFRGRCMTKPATRDEAVSFFKMFSGKEHTVLTAVTLSMPPAPLETHVEKSSVRFKELGLPQIHEYFEKFTPLDKAGAYDIREGKELIIAEYTGSFTNIMGLPEEIVEKWLFRHVQKN